MLVFARSTLIFVAFLSFFRVISRFTLWNNFHFLSLVVLFPCLNFAQLEDRLRQRKEQRKRKAEEEARKQREEEEEEKRKINEEREEKKKALPPLVSFPFFLFFTLRNGILNMYCTRRTTRNF